MSQFGQRFLTSTIRNDLSIAEMALVESERAQRIRPMINVIDSVTHWLLQGRGNNYSITLQELKDALVNLKLLNENNPDEFRSIYAFLELLFGFEHQVLPSLTSETLISYNQLSDNDIKINNEPHARLYTRPLVSFSAQRVDPKLDTDKSVIVLGENRPSVQAKIRKYYLFMERGIPQDANVSSIIANDSRFTIEDFTDLSQRDFNSKLIRIFPERTLSFIERISRSEEDYPIGNMGYTNYEYLIRANIQKYILISRVLKRELTNMAGYGPRMFNHPQGIVFRRHNFKDSYNILYQILIIIDNDPRFTVNDFVELSPEDFDRKLAAEFPDRYSRLSGRARFRRLQYRRPNRRPIPYDQEPERNAIPNQTLPPPVKESPEAQETQGKPSTQPGWKSLWEKLTGN